MMDRMKYKNKILGAGLSLIFCGSYIAWNTDDNFLGIVVAVIGLAYILDFMFGKNE